MGTATTQTAGETKADSARQAGSLLNATLTSRHDLNASLSVVRVRPDGWPLPAFEPGQFAVLGLPRDASPKEAGAASGSRPSGSGLVRRAYSIASSPHAKDDLELFVVLVEEGKLTPWLWTLEPGDRLFLDRRINGELTLDGVPADKDLVMVATGTGIAPYMSMLRTYRGQSRWRRFVLIHGVRHIADLGYRDELEATSREDPSVVYVPVVSREQTGSDWPGLHGRVQTALAADTYPLLAGAPLDPRECHVFLCGNPAMITSVQSNLEAQGFVTKTKKSPGNIHLERYW
jgi:ferredoxin--NADP+ reductase